MNNTLIVLLCKEKSFNIIQLEQLLSNNNLSYTIVCDFCSLELDGIIRSMHFYNLTRSAYIKKPSAWDKAFYIIKQDNLLAKYKYFLFIEDDVYSKNYEYLMLFIKEIKNYYQDFITKIIRPQSHYPTWQHWKEDYIQKLHNPSQSFNPICRLSTTLIEKIFCYQQENSGFNFHEILFASLCKEYKLSYIEYINDTNLNKYIGNITYNPILQIESLPDNKIYHPVKINKQERSNRYERI